MANDTNGLVDDVFAATVGDGGPLEDVDQLGVRVNPNPVTGKTAVLIAFNGGTNATTTYAWFVTAEPAGATTRTLSANNTNAAKT